jgi:outer membrane protein assembly factor BamB
MAPRHGRRRLLWLGLAAALLVAGAVVVVVVLHSRREGDVSNPGVEFQQGETQPPAPTTTQKAPAAGHHPSDDGFEWPLFGFTKSRTHVLLLRRALRPPFRRAWAARGNALLEFSPVLCRRSLYLLTDDGVLMKVSRWTGDVLWRRDLGSLAAASPACSHGRVYAVLLRGGHAVGRVVAVTARNGRVVWSRGLPARAESSPLIDRGRVYFGTENGTVYALRATNGAVRWTYHASGAVKGALALDNGKLFFGDYSGRVYAIRRRNGSPVWRVGAARGGAFGLGGGHFYSSPSVEYGRVYIGSTNGAVYSFSARDGRLAWRKQTGAYVYASPAVGQVAGGPPTVWVGSYNGRFYALNARSGSVRWIRNLGGKISGSPAVIGDLAFVSSVNLKRTWALGANTGQTIWRDNHGAFNPAISDGRRIYMNGAGTLYGLDPKGIRYAPHRHPALTDRQRRFRREKARSIAHRKARHIRYLRRTCHRLLHRHRRAALHRHHCWSFWQQHPRHPHHKARKHRRRH